MDWREQMQQGSFRGVPFLCKGSDGQLGRRIALHEYPGRDLPYPEDMGKLARQFTLELLVIGRDYMAGRDALIAAFEQPGPANLIHPWQGSLRVTVLEVKGPRESTRNGGMAEFSVSFVKAGENVQPAATLSTAEAVSGQAAETGRQVQSEFAARFDVGGPAQIVDAAGKKLGLLTAKMDQMSRQVAAAGQLAVDFVADLNDFSSGLTDLLRAPGDLALRTIGLVQDLGRIAEKPLGAIELYRQLFDFGNDDSSVPTTTPSRLQQAANQAALNSLVQRAALIAAVEQCGQLSYDSFDQALALRAELSEQLDLAAEAASDDLYAALCQLRVELVRDIAVRGADLARLGWHTPQATLPALVLAHRLYGADWARSGRESDLITRNGISHPGFVQGGQALEVLIDG